MGSDILQGKRSLPVAHALAAAPAGTPAGSDLRSALQRRDVDGVLNHLEALGTAAWVHQRVEEHTEASHSALERAHAAVPYGPAIAEIADFALGRDS